MKIDDLFIKNDNYSANIIANNDVVSENDAFIDSYGGYNRFRDACKELRIYKNCIEITVIHNELTREKIHAIKERVLSVLDALSVAHSPVFFWVERQEKDKHRQIWSLGSRYPDDDIVYQQHEVFGFLTFLDFQNSTTSVIRCIVQLNHIMEEVRQVTYDSSTCKIGKYFEVGETYMHLKGPQKYIFDWCGLQNEIFKNREVTNIINKTKLLAFQLMSLEIFPEATLKQQYIRIFNLLSNYNRRKLLKD